MAEPEETTEAPVVERAGWRPPSEELPEDRRLERWRPFAKTNWRRLLGPALVGLLVLFVVLWGLWIHSGPQRVVAAMASKYRGERSLQLTASLREDVGLAATGGTTARFSRVSRFALTYGSPNLYSCRAGGRVTTAQTVLDGTDAWVWVARLNTLYHGPAPAKVPAIWPNLVGHPAAGQGGLGDPLALVLGAAGRANVAGARFGVDPSYAWLMRLAGPPDSWAITVQQKGQEGTLVLWIDRHTHLLRQAASQTEQVGRLVVYDTTTLGAELPPRSFAFQPPAGAKVVEVRNLGAAGMAISLVPSPELP